MEAFATVKQPRFFIGESVVSSDAYRATLQSC